MLYYLLDMYDCGCFFYVSALDAAMTIEEIVRRGNQREALKFVLRNIRLGAKIEGLQRRESYELPVEAT